MKKYKYKEVSVKRLRWQCDPKSLRFKTTDELKCCKDIIGQERALKAIKLGLEVKSPGYNIYVAGLIGTGKTTTIKHILEQVGTEGPIPDDICYVHNFSHPDTPTVLKLSAGKGVSFAGDMDDLVNNLRKNLPQIFESDEYKERSKEALANIQDRFTGLFKELEEKIRKEGFSVVQVQMGNFTMPEIRPVVKDKAVPMSQLQACVEKGDLSEKECEKLKKKHEKLAEEMEKASRGSRKMEKDAQKAILDLEKQFCSPVIKDIINELKEKYPSKAVSKYLDEAETYILQNLERFKEKEEKKQQQLILPGTMTTPKDEFLEFKVNVAVDNSQLKRVPVVTETVPNYKNLFGTIERAVDRSGVSHTDFTRIKAGSLLKANGGEKLGVKSLLLTIISFLLLICNGTTITHTIRRCTLSRNL